MKYKNVATKTIAIDITDEYSIIAMISWNRDTSDCNIRFYINKNNIELLDFIFSKDNMFQGSDIKAIKHDVVRYVETNFKKGTFHKYIDRYEYMLKCFDVGNDYFENEELFKEDSIC